MLLAELLRRTLPFSTKLEKPQARRFFIAHARYGGGVGGGWGGGGMPLGP